MIKHDRSIEKKENIERKTFMLHTTPEWGLAGETLSCFIIMCMNAECKSACVGM